MDELSSGMFHVIKGIFNVGVYTKRRIHIERRKIYVNNFYSNI